jgi:hypothetical protein
MKQCVRCSRDVVIASLLCCLIGVGGHFSPVHAVTVTSNDVVTVELDNLQAGSFTQLAMFLDLSSTNPFGPNEAFRARLFDGANTLISIRNSQTVSSVFDTQFAVLFNPGLFSPIDNTGFVIIDQIVGSLEITGIRAAFPDISGQFGFGFPQQFVVTPALPLPGAVPLPGALPLFATGLGALGLLAWRRKRKAAAH